MEEEIRTSVDSSSSVNLPLRTICHVYVITPSFHRYFFKFLSPNFLISSFSISNANADATSNFHTIHVLVVILVTVLCNVTRLVKIHTYFGRQNTIASMGLIFRVL